MTSNSGTGLIASRSGASYALGMQDTYAIIWVANYREGQGVGTKRFCQMDAELLAAELNRHYPQCEHKAVDTATVKVKEALALLRHAVTTHQSDAGQALAEAVTVPAGAAIQTCETACSDIEANFSRLMNSSVETLSNP